MGLITGGILVGKSKEQMMFPFHFGMIFRFQPLLWVVVWYIYIYTYVFYVHPYLRKMTPIWTSIFFQMGWFNHQLVLTPSFAAGFFFEWIQAMVHFFKNLSWNLSPNNHHSYYFWKIIHWYCWWFRNPVNSPAEGSLSVYPIICDRFYHHPNGGCPWDFWAINSM